MARVKRLLPILAIGTALTGALMLSAPIPSSAGKATTSVAALNPTDPSADIQRRAVSVKSGDTLMKLLRRQGITRSTAYQAIAALKAVFDPRRLKVGQEITLIYAPAQAGGRGVLSGLAFKPDPKNLITVARQGDTFRADAQPIALDTVLSQANGTISGSLYEAARDAGLPIPVLMRLISLFSYDVDFQRDIQPGDRFEVLYERLVDAEGSVVDQGDIVYGALTLSGEKVQLYAYTDAEGSTDYYNVKGESYRRALLRTPIDGARISSGFGKRRDPIQGYTKNHTGIDFAAARGTPIYAGGDGVIDYIGRNGSYGKYIRVRHNTTYSTAYAHLNGYRKGLKRGSRVKQGQVIAYVGSTGRSTGPHLHYEILKNGKQVNPLRVKMPAGRRLAEAELQRFRVHVDQLRAQFAALADDKKLAER